MDTLGNLISLKESKQQLPEKPMVSVCCTTFQHKPYIKDAIEGFLMQKTNFPVEIIIRDDASKDGTTEIVAEYAAKFPNIIRPVLEKENTFSKGVRPMATCMSYAKGKYIAMCEGDDYWTDPHKLQRQVDLLESDNEISLSTENGLVKFTKGNREDILFNPCSDEKYYSAYEMLEERRFPTASVLFPAKYSADILKLKISGDTILWTLLSTKGKVHYNPIVSSVYNRGFQGVVMGTPKIEWAKRMEQWNIQIKEILMQEKGFDMRIFRQRNFSEYYSAYKQLSYKKDFYNKIFALYKCIINFPIKKLRNLL